MNKKIKIIAILSLLLTIFATIENVETQINSDSSKYVKTQKSSEYNEDTHMIDYNLNAYQDSVINSSEQVVPLDIVLVLDLSSSMDEFFADSGYRRINSRINTFGDLFEYFENGSQLYYMTHNSYPKVRINRNGKNYKIEGVKGEILQGRYDTELPIQLYEFLDRTNDGERGITRMEALQVSVDNFIKKLEHSATKYNVDHRVAFVSFSGDLYSDNSKGTGLLATTDESRFIPFHEVSTDKASSSLIKVTDINKIRSASSRIISEVDYTSTHLGMDLARRIIKVNKADTRKATVVLFTDGDPNGYPPYDVPEVSNKKIAYDIGKEYGYFDVDSDPNYGSANEAVKHAHIIKQIYNTDIYTIAIHDQANPKGSIVYNQIKSNASTIDRFMHMASSNYTEADLSKVTDIYNVNDTKYYKDAKSSTELTEVFEYVLKEIIQTEETNLNENTVVYDSFPNIIDIQGIALDNFSVYTQKHLGNGAWGEREYFNDATIAIDHENRALKVSGFDFTANLINQEQAGGSRIGISFSAPIRPGFIGGNNVVTNGPDSGIYHDDIEGPISLFPIPTVDVPLRFDVESRNHDIYLSNEFELNELLYRDNQFEYQIGHESYTLDGINNKYVDVSIDIIEGEKVIHSIHVPKGTTFDYVDLETKVPYINDVNFKLLFKVQADKESKQVNTQSVLSVYKPEISVKDTVSYLGEAMNFSNNITSPSSVLWLHKNNRDITTKYDKPVVSYLIDGDIYHDKQQCLEADQLFSYQVLLDDKDYTEEIVKNSTFKHKIKTLELSVKKDVNKKYSDADQFLFNLKWVKPKHLSHFKDYDVDFVLKGQDEIVIKGLPLGYYSLSEDTDWSWRYELKSENNINFELKAHDTLDYVFEFENKLKNKQYLSKEVIVENKFGVGD